MIKQQAHKIFEKYHQAANEFRKLPASCIILNTITDGCTWSSVAGASIIGPSHEAGPTIIRSFFIASAIACASTRFLGEIKLAHAARVMKEFMEAGPPINIERFLNPETHQDEVARIGDAQNLPKSLKSTKIKSFDALNKPRFSWLQKLNKTTGDIAEFVPDQFQYVVQAVMQLPVVALTTLLVVSHLDTKTNIVSCLLVFGFNSVGNVLSFIQPRPDDPLSQQIHKAKLTQISEKETLGEFAKRFAKNPNTHWAVAFMIAGGTLLVQFTPLTYDVISTALSSVALNVVYAAAVAHTALVALPKTHQAVVSKMDSSSLPFLRALAPVIANKNLSLLVFTAACAGEALKAQLNGHLPLVEKMPRVDAMVEWAFACTSIYGAKAHHGFSQMIDHYFPTEKPTRGDPQQNISRARPLILERL
jgi:hypothetical protein